MGLLKRPWWGWGEGGDGDPCTLNRVIPTHTQIRVEGSKSLLSRYQVGNFISIKSHQPWLSWTRFQQAFPVGLGTVCAESGRGVCTGDNMHLPLKPGWPHHCLLHFLNIALTLLKCSQAQAWVYVTLAEEELDSQEDYLTEPRLMGGRCSSEPTSPYRVLDGPGPHQVRGSPRGSRWQLEVSMWPADDRARRKTKRDDPNLGRNHGYEDLGMGVQDNRRLGKFPNARKEDSSRGVKEAWHAHG